METNDEFNPRELADLFTEVVGEAHSDGGLVTVKVDPQGRVAGIWLDPKVTSTSVERLAAAITTVCADAFDNRVDRLGEVIDEYQRTHGLVPDVLNFLHASLASLRRKEPQQDQPTGEQNDAPPAVTCTDT